MLENKFFIKLQYLLYLIPFCFIQCSDRSLHNLPSYEYTILDSADAYFGKWISIKNLDSNSVILTDTLSSVTFNNAYEELNKIIQSNELIWNTVSLNDSVVNVSKWERTEIKSWMFERVFIDSSIIKSDWEIPNRLRLCLLITQEYITVKFRTNPIDDYHIWSNPNEYMQYTFVINRPPEEIGSRLQYSLISALIEWDNKQLLEFDKVTMRIDCDDSDSYNIRGRTMGGKAIFLDMDGGNNGRPEAWDDVAIKWAKHYNLSWDTTYYPSGGFRARAEPRILLSMRYPTIVVESQNGGDRHFSFSKSEKGHYGFGKYWRYLCSE